MYALDNSSGVKVMPVVNNQIYGPDEPRWFTEGGNGVAPSYPGADWFNVVQAELLNVVKTAGGTPDKQNLTQLADAIQKLIDGSTNQLISFLDSLVGVPTPIPTATVPKITIPGYSYITMIGQRFDTSKYPKLAAVYKSGVLPDMRGEFIRGWDNGRGVDSGRDLLSTQGDAIRNITGWVDGQVGFGTSSDLFTLGNQAYSPVSSATFSASHRFSFDASKVVPTASENRPRNVALQYICLAG